MPQNWSGFSADLICEGILGEKNQTFIDYYLLLVTIVLACVLIIVEAFAVKVNASKSTADSQNNEILFNVVMVFPLFVKFLFVLLLRKESTCVFILF